MRNEMLRGRVLRYMYAFRLSRCGTRVAVCQQHFAKRHLTQSRNDENDFSFFSLSFLLPLSLFLPPPPFFFVPTRLFASNSTYTLAREKNDDYPRSVRRENIVHHRPMWIARTMYIFIISLVEKSIGNDICDSRGFVECLSFSTSSFLPRDWNAVLESLRGKSGCSKGDRYRRDIPPSLTGISLSRRLLTWHDTWWLWSRRRWILRTRRIMSFSPKKGERRRRRKKGGIITG